MNPFCNLTKETLSNLMVSIFLVIGFFPTLRLYACIVRHRSIQHGFYSYFTRHPGKFKLVKQCSDAIINGE